jgi:hypothetical protein
MSVGRRASFARRTGERIVVKQSKLRKLAKKADKKAAKKAAKKAEKRGAKVDRSDIRLV